MESSLVKLRHNNNNNRKRVIAYVTLYKIPLHVFHLIPTAIQHLKKYDHSHFADAKTEVQKDNR